MRLQKLLPNSIKSLLFAGFFALFALPSFAQDELVLPTSNSDSLNLILKQLASTGMPGNVRIIPHDERILDLLWKHVNYNDSIGIYGWKVLVYNGRSRTDAIEAESLFLNSFPDVEVPSKVIYPEPPDFKTPE